jgi:hypothetical protein
VLPTVSIGDRSFVEGNSGTTSFVFDVTLSNASYLPVLVPYSTADGPAIASTDYTPASGTLTIAAGGEGQCAVGPRRARLI